MFGLIATTIHGQEHLIAKGHNPTEIRAQHTKVSRNPDLIKTIEFRDHESTIDKIWDASWRLVD